MGTRAEPAKSLREHEREWWVNTLAVVNRPRAVFEALGEDMSEEGVAARQEPLLAVIWLAGMAGVLLTTAAAHLLDNWDVDGLVLAVWVFVAGGIYGAAGYWLAGGAVYAGLKGAESPTPSYRRSRHVLGLAAVPLALSLAVWPVRLAVYGSDLFKSGGSDTGAGDVVFRVILLAFAAWAIGLLVLGIRTTEGWSWRRSVAAVALAAAMLGLFGAIPIVL
jgi:Yip1-like protein